VFSGMHSCSFLSGVVGTLRDGRHSASVRLHCSVHAVSRTCASVGLETHGPHGSRIRPTPTLCSAAEGHGVSVSVEGRCFLSDVVVFVQPICSSERASEPVPGQTRARIVPELWPAERTARRRVGEGDGQQLMTVHGVHMLSAPRMPLTTWPPQ